MGVSMSGDNQKAGSLQTEIRTVYRTAALGLEDARSCAGHRKHLLHLRAEALIYL